MTRRLILLLPPLCLCLFAVLAATAQVGDDLTVLKADPNGVPPRKMLATYLLAEANKHFADRREVIKKLATADDVKRRQEDLKAKFLKALGGFPEKTPLNAKVVGVEKRDGYRMEKVIFESRPQHHVTANFYLPEGKGPFPGVIVPCGHSANGKGADAYQRVCILMAKNGIAALIYDPIGQGERYQLLDPPGKPVTGSTNEHSLVGVGALLVGQSTATYRIWDGIRALDYLASRPEVDAKKLGCTGNSGGGTLTSYLMALDDRIFAAAPSCYITSLERLFATIGPQDAEQNITGQVAFGMEHADYITMRAPRPTLLLLASQDFFDIKGSWDSYREAKLIYGMMGYSERAEVAEYNTKHGYGKGQRESAVRFMRRWLAGKDEVIFEEPFATAKDKDLQCTRTGQVLEDFKGVSAFDLNVLREKELAPQRSKFLAGKREDVLKEIRRLIAVPETIKPAKVQEVGVVKRAGLTIRKLIYETEPGIQVPGLLFIPEKLQPMAKTVIILDDQDKSRYTGEPGGQCQAVAATGHRALVLDLRGMGETAPGVANPKIPSFFGTTFKESFLSLHLNRPLLGQRVFDLLSVIENLRQDKMIGKGDFQIEAHHNAGPIALHAMVLDNGIRSLSLNDSLISWSAVVRSPISYDQLANVVPGVLGYYDLPDLAGLVAPRMLGISNPVDAQRNRVSQEVLEEAYAGCKAAYSRANAGKNLQLGAGR